MLKTLFDPHSKTMESGELKAPLSPLICKNEIAAINHHKWKIRTQIP